MAQTYVETASGGASSGGTALLTGRTYVETASGGIDLSCANIIIGEITATPAGGVGQGGQCLWTYTTVDAARQALPFFMVQSSDSETPWVGTPQVLLRKAGGGITWITPAGTVAAIGNGFYQLQYALTDQDTPGPLYLYAYSADGSADPHPDLFWIGQTAGWKQADTTIPLPIYLWQAGPNLPVTGATGLSVQVGPGGGLLGPPSAGASLVEAGHGFYDFWPGADDIADAGYLSVYCTATGAMPARKCSGWARQQPRLQGPDGYERPSPRRLNGLSTITALTSTRIWPLHPPQSWVPSTGPCLTYDVTSEEFDPDLDGVTSTGSAQVELRAVSLVLADAEDVMAQVIAAFPTIGTDLPQG